MRRFPFAALILLVPLALCGCRQTAGPTAAGPIAPMSPTGTMSPVSAGQAPVLNPFGGPTRVTPPATGSNSASNGYLGAAVPAGPTQTESGPTAGVLLSGVQAAGWTETGSPVGLTPQASQVQPPATAAPNPRSGGMQVIDLTTSPPPPGYQPSAARWPAPAASPGYAPQMQPIQPYPGQNYPFQNVQSPVMTSGGFESRPVQAVTVPPGNEIANAAAALRPLEDSSTEPVPGSSSSGQDLSWRRPGVRY